MSCHRLAPRATYALGIGVLLVVVLLSVVLADYGYDDPYITYRYARNLVLGNGFVYNVGEPVLSTTTPGYALLLAALGWVHGNIPLLGNVLSAVGLGLGAWALGLWASEARQPFAGWAAGLLLLTFPLLLSTFGSEMVLYIGVLLCGFYLYACRHPGYAMAVMGAATLLRPDGVLAAGVISMHLIVTQRRMPWKPLAVYAMVLLPWAAYGTWFFGSPLPVTLVAKQAQGRMEISDSFAWGAWTLFRNYLREPFYWLLLPLNAIGFWQIVTRKREWLLLLLWSVCYLAGYVVLGVSRYFWYYAPLVPGVLVSAAVGLDWVRAAVSRWRTGSPWQWVVALSILASLLWPNLERLQSIATHPDRRLSAYRYAGQWIDANLPADASLGTLEVGIIGYYASRRIIGFAGLLQPEAARHVSAQTTYEDIAAWAVGAYEPDYLLLGEGWFPNWTQSPEFSSRYAQVRSFEQEGDAFTPLLLYGRSGGSER